LLSNKSENNGSLHVYKEGINPGAPTGIVHTEIFGKGEAADRYLWKPLKLKSNEKQ
jgi:hypothetical protein